MRWKSLDEPIVGEVVYWSRYFGVLVLPDWKWLLCLLGVEKHKVINGPSDHRMFIRGLPDETFLFNNSVPVEIIDAAQDVEEWLDETGLAAVCNVRKLHDN